MKPLITLILLGVALVLFVSSAFTVDQTQQIFITEFGKPVRTINADPAKNEAGLHFKKPFIQQVNRIEKRILEWDGPAIEMPTRDKLYITVDNFARWRISDPKTYFEKIRDERSALSRLNDIIGSETRNVIAAHDLIEVIRSEQKASVSLLQRRLRLGYGRAARIMDELENRGIVGPSNGAEPRDILIDLDGGGADGQGPFPLPPCH